MIKAVIFDMDGVLIDSEPVNLQIIREFYLAHGKQAEESYLRALVGRSIHDTWHLSKEQWKDDISFEAYTALYHDFRLVHPIDYPSILFPDVKPLMIWLKEQGYKLAIASSSKLHTIENVIKQCALEDIFDIKMSGEMFKKSKPDPEIYVATARNLGFPVEECIAIEDSKAGMTSCIAANMKVIAKIDLRYGADPSQADYQVENLLEVKDILMKLNDGNE